MTHATPRSVGRGICYVLIAATAWGTGGAVAAILYQTTGLGPVAVSFWRFAGGVLLLAAGQLVLRNRYRRRSGQPWHRLLIVGVGLAVYQTAYFASVGYAGLAIATVATLGTGPVLIALGARTLLGERLGRAGLVAIAVALAGLVLLVGGGTAGAAGAPLLGLAFALLSALGYAGVTLLHRHLGRSGGGGAGQTTLGGFALGAVCLLPLAVLEGLLPSGGDLRHTALLLAYLGAVPTALAYGLFFAGLASVRATTASVLALVEAVTAAAIAAVLLGERLTGIATVGAVVLLGAVAVLAVAERGSSRLRRARPAPARR